MEEPPSGKFREKALPFYQYRDQGSGIGDQKIFAALRAGK
jgi:hypothetical protein